MANTIRLFFINVSHSILIEYSYNMIHLKFKGDTAKFSLRNKKGLNSIGKLYKNKVELKQDTNN